MKHKHQIPILFLSDSPSLPTGLARITKDLAVHCCSIPELKVGVLGRGGIGSSKLPFVQYNFPESDQWGENHIEHVWQDFAGNKRGIVFTIWDPSRLDWFAQPRMEGRLGEFLRSGRFDRWGYMPVDAVGVGGRLTGLVKDTLLGYNRVLAYTLFGKSVLESTLGAEVNWMPHGFNANTFYPREKTAGRLALGVADDAPLVGCVMTNQARKDWATALGAVRLLRNQKPDLKCWAHVDVPMRYWNLYALIEDLGLGDTVKITYNGDFNSDQLAMLYSACDITMLPSLGEGFGYPIVESLACGVPCLHGNYGGGAELIPDKSWLVEPVGNRVDGLWNLMRPIWNADDWANTLSAVMDEAEGVALQEVCTGAVEHLQWGRLWPQWKKWVLAGIEAGAEERVEAVAP